MLAYADKIRDRTPDVRAAGKLKPQGGGAGECLTQSQGGDGCTPTPDVVRQFRGMTQPEPGQKRVFHSFASDPPVPHLAHGIKTKSSLAAGDLLNPPPKTRFQQVQLDQQEYVYNSKRTAPLGSSHDQSQGLPSSMDVSKMVFGTSTLKEESAGSIVSPQKSSTEVEEEYNVGKELYKKSHNDWGVGEMVDREYDWSKFTRQSLYGVPTPHDNSGSQVKCALHWMHEAQSAKHAQVVSRRVDDFRERTQPQLGKVHDPIAETLDVPEDHTFGVMVQPDEFNTGELMQMEGPSTYQQCQGLDIGVLSSIRHHLKKNNFYNFDGLLDALQSQDKAELNHFTLFKKMLVDCSAVQFDSPSATSVPTTFPSSARPSSVQSKDRENELEIEDSCGRIAADEVREACFQFNVPLTPDMLELLITWCMVEEEGGCEGVMYQEMVQLLNWKTEVADSVLTAISKSHTTKSQAPHDLDPLPTAGKRLSSPLLTSNYRTSSQMIKATVGRVPTHNYRTYGVPTIRSDLPAPQIRRVGDSTNYGDESGAYGLMYPSIYSNRGVYEDDFFAPRSPEEIKQVFANIGVSMTPEVFEELWKEAVRRDPKGQVSVESFRAVMEEVQANQLLHGQPSQPTEGEPMASTA